MQALIALGAAVRHAAMVLALLLLPGSCTIVCWLMLPIGCMSDGHLTKRFDW